MIGVNIPQIDTSGRTCVIMLYCNAHYNTSHSKYGNGDPIHVILNGEPLEEVNCFLYLGSQVAADGGCEWDVVHRMNEGCAEKCPEQ